MLRLTERVVNHLRLGYLYVHQLWTWDTQICFEPRLSVKDLSPQYQQEFRAVAASTVPMVPKVPTVAFSPQKMQQI